MLIIHTKKFLRFLTSVEYLSIHVCATKETSVGTTYILQANWLGKLCSDFLNKDFRSTTTQPSRSCFIWKAVLVTLVNVVTCRFCVLRV